MQGLAVCQNGKNTWSFVWLHPLLTSGFPLGMTSPNVTASLCFLVCVLVSATSAIPASSSLLPLLPRIYFLRYSCSIINFPLSLLLLPLSSLPPLRSFLCCIRYPCFLASAPSPPLPLTLLPLPLPLSLLVAARERPWPPARAEVLAKASERACVILLGDVEVHWWWRWR